MKKVMDIEQAAALVPDGSALALGGLSMNSSPMAFARELIRQKKRGLTVVAIVNGMAVDWLVAAGCVSKVISGLISFEGMGLAPNFRHAVESGAVELEEYSEYLLIARLRAAATNLPFIPTKAGLGTDVIGLHPETTRLESDPVSGEAYVACTPLKVDVAVVHAHAADAQGNVRVDPKLLWMDNEIVNAAGSTIVTVESIVPHSSFVAEPHRTTYPRFITDAVVEVPWGAYPTSCFPIYGHDEAFFSAYSKAARSPERFREFWNERLAGPDTHDAFLQANGGAQTVNRIRRPAT
jgi:acyl CoA:acetate/3-ketoacid CoA transferase alpha subunit